MKVITTIHNVTNMHFVLNFKQQKPQVSKNSRRLQEFILMLENVKK